MNSLVIACLCFFTFFPSIKGNSQTNDSTKVLRKGIFISGGPNKTSFYNGDFGYFLAGLTGTTKPKEVGSDYSLDSGSTRPNKYSYGKTSFSPTLNLGFIYNSGRIKNIFLNHIFEISCSQMAGQCSYISAYQEEASGGEFQSWADITDTIQLNYKLSSLSIDYKFQPTYKFLFLSFGINCSVSFATIEDQKNEHEKDILYELEFFRTDYSFSHNESTNKYNEVFFSFPIQLGAGAHININNIYIEPGFYFTPCFMKGYNIYNASIRFIYSLK
jgi:hypothetical protein